MAPFPIGTFVETFLDREKEDARRLIRYEMESMLDPLVESLFGQLKAKFVDYVEASWGYEQEHQLENHQGGDGQMFHDQEAIVNAHQYHCQLSGNVHSIDANSQFNSTNHLEPPLMLPEEQIDYGLSNRPNFQLVPQQNDDPINSPSSSAHEIVPMIPSTDASLPDTEMQQQQQQLSHNEHNQFDDEGECDCDECVYGKIEEKEEKVDDDNNSVQLIDDDQEDEDDSSRPVKKPRMDSTQPNDALPEVYRQSTSQSIDEAQRIKDWEENVDRMESEPGQAMDTQATNEHYDDDGQYNSGGSMAIQPEQSDPNKAIEKEIANESTSNSIRPKSCPI